MESIRVDSKAQYSNHDEPPDKLFEPLRTMHTIVTIVTPTVRPSGSPAMDNEADFKARKGEQPRCYSDRVACEQPFVLPNAVRQRIA